jgi:hypothetical protein
VPTGSDTLESAYAKLDWASSRHDEMERIFIEFARPGGGDERPYGIKFHQPGKPEGLVVASFIMEKSLPVEMSLLAADLIHNARVALDHTLARLKDSFGGSAARGSFPVCQDETGWQNRVATAGSRSPLAGLDGSAAFDLIYDEQPLHRTDPAADPLVVLNKLDNADKHRAMHPAFAYTDAKRGTDLIAIHSPNRCETLSNQWNSGDPLEHGTRLATFLVRGTAKGVVGSRDDAPIGFATGGVDSPHVGYTDTIARVRGIVDEAAGLIDK